VGVGAGIGLEVDHRPSRGLAESEIDHAFDQRPVFEPVHERLLPPALQR